MNIRQLHLITAIALAGMTLHPAGLQAKEYKIPATQADFESMWEVVPGEVEGTWTWVDYDTPYASSPTVNEGETGASLILREPIAMNTGDVYNLQALVSTDHYNNDGWFHIVYGTDKNNLTAMKDDYSSFKCWGKSGGGPDFKVKPADSSPLKTLTISEAGDYYIGIRTKKGSKAGTLFYVASLLIEKDVNYPQRVTNTKAVADATGNLEVTLSWNWPKKNKDNSDLTGEVGANIYRSTSDTKAELYKPEQLIATVSGGKAEESCTFVDNAANSTTAITEAGTYYYYIAPFTEAGENNECASSAITKCKWVGEDVKPLNPLNVVAKPVGDNVEISWKARTEGYNGGYINPDLLGHKITRSKDGAEAVTIVEDYRGDSPYTDTTLDGPASYVYSVMAVYKGEESSVQKAAAIFAGGSYETPYEDDFSDSKRFDLYTKASDNSGANWIRDYKGYIKFCGPYYGNATGAVMTPPLKLEAGKTYKISCLSWVDETEEEEDYGWGGWTEPDAKDLMLTAGAEPTLDGQTELIKINIDKGSDSKITSEAYFSPSESGAYYFGLKSTASNRNYIYADDLKIEESVMLPATVTDLSMTPDAAGALNATISFTIPDKSNAGTPLTELSKVTVTRYDYIINDASDPENGTPAMVVVKELEGEDATPGKQVTFVDEVPHASMYFYTAVSTLGESESEPTESAQAWIGYDTPKSISSFMIRAEISGNGEAVVTWPAISGTELGIHKGYVDADNLKYRVFRKPATSEADFEQVGETSELSYTDLSLKEADWDNYQYGVAPLNGTMQGNISVCNKVSGGKITAFPYSPDLTDDNFIESLPGRSFICEEGLAFKNRGEQGTMEYIAYLPPFDATDMINGKPQQYSIDLALSRVSPEYEELIEVLLCEVERKSLDLESAGSVERDAAVIPGEETRTSLTTIPVTASSDEPVNESVNFSVPATGRYRLALRCASDYNKGLTIHSLKVDNPTLSSVSKLSGNGNVILAGRTLILPEDAETLSIFTTEGICVSTTEVAGLKHIDTSGFAAGLYIVNVTTSDRRAITMKLMVK